MEDKTMLFNYMIFLQELRDNPEKIKLIERWEKISSAISIEEEPYYAYLKKFTVNDIPYKVPEDLSDLFDWKLLFQLVAASVYSDYRLSYPNLEEIDTTNEVDSDNELPELRISVKSEKRSASKTVSELSVWQILRLFEIYVEEQINLHILKCEEEKEKVDYGISADCEKRFTKFDFWQKASVKFRNDKKQRKIRQDILNGL